MDEESDTLLGLALAALRERMRKEQGAAVSMIHKYCLTTSSLMVDGLVVGLLPHDLSTVCMAVMVRSDEKLLWLIERTNANLERNPDFDATSEEADIFRLIALLQAIREIDFWEFCLPKKTKTNVSPQADFVVIAASSAAIDRVTDEGHYESLRRSLKVAGIGLLRVKETGKARWVNKPRKQFRFDHVGISDPEPWINSYDQSVLYKAEVMEIWLRLRGDSLL